MSSVNGTDFGRIAADEGVIQMIGNCGIPRGLNELWTNGGLIYAPPIK